MGKKKSSASKKQQSLAAAVEEAEQEVNEIKLSDNTVKRKGTSKAEGMNEPGKKNTAVEIIKDEEEFEFDYTAGENIAEEDGQDSIQGVNI